MVTRCPNGIVYLSTSNYILILDREEDVVLKYGVNSVRTTTRKVPRGQKRRRSVLPNEVTSYLINHVSLSDQHRCVHCTFGSVSLDVISENANETGHRED